MEGFESPKISCRFSWNRTGTQFLPQERSDAETDFIVKLIVLFISLQLV